jgi:hypothetical protein
MNRLSSHKYLALLLALLLLLVAYPVFHGPAGSPVLFRVLLTAVCAAGAWAVFADRHQRLVGAVLAVPAVVGAWTGYALPDLPRPVAAILLHLSAAVFMVFVTLVLLRGVIRERTVSADAIFGSLCGYLLVGVAFGHAYCLIEATIPGSFRGTDGAVGGREHFVLTYFSFITLTTSGYGDITPASDPARAAVMIEAVTGQFYVAVLIAGLVGKWIGQVPGPPPPGSRADEQA